MLQIRDPLHGAIPIDASELAIVDHPYVQRLRHIRQTGFSYLPFPGATHSRYSHSLGVMHLAGMAFDQAFRNWQFSSEAVRRRFRGLVRLAALCHDLGHAPFSHCTEFAMPPLASLGLGWYREVDDRRASHEDYTIAILAHTTLADAIARHFPFTAREVAALISADVVVPEEAFSDLGLDHRRILSQIVSSELDCDRLDYLGRDSYYTGARYGQIDVPWILSNLSAFPMDGGVSLALDGRAIYAFDDFLIARHHMFLQVYFHHKSVVYEEMLKRYVTSRDCEWSLPADLEAYLRIDDIALESHLRTAQNGWARRIVEQRPYRRVVERHGAPDEVDLEREKALLFDAGIGVIHTASTGRLSRYEVVGKKRSRAAAILVLERLPGMAVEQVQPLGEASGVFARYADARRITRLYVAPEEVDRARKVLGLPGREA
jgi:HD superfamily phosphohydrolase